MTWRWGDVEQKAFDDLKQLLVTKPVLALYDGEAETELHCDASSQGLAGILQQRQATGDLKPVAFFSRVTSPQESVYHSYELETLAVVEAVKRFRVYLVGVHFKVVTDCAAVRATMAKRDIATRIARWWMSLQGYDMEVEYRPGVKMQHVDSLSRNPVAVNMVHVGEEDWFLTVQLQDEKAQTLVKMLKGGVADSGVKAAYRVVDGRFYRRTPKGDRLYVPAMAKFSLVRKHHDDIGHPGVRRCLALIGETYWFPKMRRFVEKYVKACLDCAFSKGTYGRGEGFLHPIPKPSNPFDTVHIDHLGPFARSVRGNSYLLVLVDSFTKFTIAKACRTLRSGEAIQKLKEIFGEFGYPRRVVSDRGLAFTSNAFGEFLATHGVKHTLNAVATPRANGQVERQNRTIVDAPATSIDNEARWDERVPEIVCGMNHRLNSSTQFSHARLMFAHSTGVMTDLEAVEAGCSKAVGDEAKYDEAKYDEATGEETLTKAGEAVPTGSKKLLSRRRKATENLIKVGEAMKTRYDKRRKVATNYEKGDLVLWRQGGTSIGDKGVNRKLSNKYEGPYKVTKVLGKDRYDSCCEGSQRLQKVQGDCTCRLCKTLSQYCTWR